MGAQCLHRLCRCPPKKERGHISVPSAWFPIPAFFRRWLCRRLGGLCSLCGARALVSPGGSLCHTVLLHGSRAPSENSWAPMLGHCMMQGLQLSCWIHAENIRSPKMWQSKVAHCKTEGWNSPHAASPEARERDTRVRMSSKSSRAQSTAFIFPTYSCTPTCTY